MTNSKKDKTPSTPVEDARDETKDASPVEVAPEADKAAEPVEFNPDEIEESEDDGTTREEGLNGPDKIEEK